MGLAQPEAGGNWQFESKRYQYWTRAGMDGAFAIPHVRPGRYTLYAFNTGALGEFTKAEVEVAAGRPAELGELMWEVPHQGRIAWEIGVPDRSAGEFAHGTDYFHGYGWERFEKEFANPVEFTIGKSDPATDWNYVQCGYGVKALTPWRWRVHFALESAPAKEATLVLAIASANGANIQVFANDGAKAVATVTPSVQGGDALLRESIHAKYCVERVAIPAGRLRAGENMISLELAGVKNIRQHVMYDYLALEVK